jgi:hypothetical protein
MSILGLVSEISGIIDRLQSEIPVSSYDQSYTIIYVNQYRATNPMGYQIF